MKDGQYWLLMALIMAIGTEIGTIAGVDSWQTAIRLAGTLIVVGAAVFYFWRGK